MMLEAFLRPLRNRIANLVARGTVTLVNNALDMQKVQLTVMSGEPVEGDDGLEHFQPVGFRAVPAVGAEAVVVFPNGYRGLGLVIAVSDRRGAPTGDDPGTVTVYSPTSSAKIIMLPDGTIEVQPAAGKAVNVREPGGTLSPLVRKSEYDGHTHAPGTFVAPGGGGPVTGLSGGAPAVSGTPSLRG
jgi:phage baseplate assembly protein V